MSTGDGRRARRQMHGPLQSFDLDAEVASLREEKEWREGRRCSAGEIPAP